MKRTFHLPVLDTAGKQNPAPASGATSADPESPLADRFARIIRYLRVSLTDRCNYRCTYCMPEEGVTLAPRQEILSFEELVRLASVFAGLGVRRLRLTGGEPTVRRGLVELIRMLVRVPGIDQVVMTTNGHLLPELAAPLAAAGLAEVNVSLDTVDPERFRRLTRRGDVSRVLAGIEAARTAGLEVKINAVALRGDTEADVGPVCAYAWERGITPRFIEHMPMSEGALYTGLPLSASEIRAAVAAHFGDAVEPADPASAFHGPARYFRLTRAPQRRFGVISAMTEHFCDDCNRLRLSATGQLHTCLGHDDATDLRSLLRGGGDDDSLRRAIWTAVAAKRRGHEFQLSGLGGPAKHMVSIGG